MESPAFLHFATRQRPPGQSFQVFHVEVLELQQRVQASAVVFVLAGRHVCRLGKNVHVSPFNDLSAEVVTICVTSGWFTFCVLYCLERAIVFQNQWVALEHINFWAIQKRSTTCKRSCMKNLMIPVVGLSFSCFLLCGSCRIVAPTLNVQYSRLSKKACFSQRCQRSGMPRVVDQLAVGSVCSLRLIGCKF